MTPGLLHSHAFPFLRGVILATLTTCFSVSASGANPPTSKAAASAALAALPAGVVAKVNDVAITQDQLDFAVRASGTPDTPQLRTSLKNQLVARELFRQVAQKAHYDTHNDVRAAVEQAKTLAMTQAYLRDNVKPAPVTDEQLKAQYDTIIATLGDNEFQPSVIIVDDADTAKKVLDQLKKGGDFAQQAKQFSKGPTAAQGGTVSWISFKLPLQEGHTQNWPLPLAEALIKLPEGGVSSAPTIIDGKYYLLHLNQKRPTQIPQLDAIKEVLRRQLQQVAMEKATTQVVVDLMKTARIQE